MLTSELMQDFSPVYITTKQQADICNSFLVIIQPDRQTHRDTFTK